MDLLNKQFAVDHDLELGIESSFFHRAERILQFGTGHLLRGLVDYLVEKGNRQKCYDGSIVMLKSTDDDTSSFTNQDNLFTVIEKGLDGDQVTTQTMLVTSISRVIAVSRQWDEFIDLACEPFINTIISNTTEAGLVYQPEDIMGATAPKSFPAKLTRFLWERYQNFRGDPDSGYVILPTELIVDNGDLLKRYVIRHAESNGIPGPFYRWLNSSNRFCNTLVDRIIPGKSAEDDEVEFNHLHYTDHLHTTTESFLLWAVEGDDRVKEMLGFHKADPRMVIAKNIKPFREQKLRILNGSNTFVAALAYLYGCNTTYDTMQDPLMRQYIERQIDQEILPTISRECPDAKSFSQQVLERFCNPGIHYPLLNITLQYCSKMNSRNGMTFVRYHRENGRFPELCSLGMAAFLLFYTPAGEEHGKFYGQRGLEKYGYRDDHAQTVCRLLEQTDWNDPAGVEDCIKLIFSDTNIFTEDFLKMDGFAGHIAALLIGLKKQGIRETLENILSS